MGVESLSNLCRIPVEYISPYPPMRSDSTLTPQERVSPPRVGLETLPAPIGNISVAKTVIGTRG